MAAARARKTTRAAAAAAEVAENPEPKVVQFGALELALPDDLPAVVAMDFAVIDSDIMAAFRFLDAVLGREQYLAVRASAVALSESEFTDKLGALLTDVGGRYGLAPGE